MTIVIQIVVIMSALTIISIALGRRSTHSGKAWKKIALILFAVTMAIAVMFPELTDALAHLFGVGRGADLLLYMTVIAFIFYTLNNYLHQQDQRDASYRLARKIALIDANERYNIKK